MLQEGQVVGRYAVVSKLGEGATSRVYRVRHRDFGAEVALKVSAHRSWMTGQRLALEARAGHPATPDVTDILDFDRVPALVMDPFAWGTAGLGRSVCIRGETGRFGSVVP